MTKDHTEADVIERPMPKITHEHNGKTFTAIGFYKGITVWPIDEFLSRRGDEFSKQEQMIMRRLNKEGVVEGNNPRML
tara:strand:+ start:382 stop:615 length:234 start_codon:yes stop_codon:yes gene_type:complete